MPPSLLSAFASKNEKQTARKNIAKKEKERQKMEKRQKRERRRMKCMMSDEKALKGVLKIIGQL